MSDSGTTTPAFLGTRGSRAIHKSSVLLLGDPDRDLRTRDEAEFVKNMFDVANCGVRSDQQIGGDVLVRHAPGHQYGDLTLAWGQSSPLGCRSGAGRAG